SPMASSSRPASCEQCEKCKHCIQFGGDELVKVKDGAGKATLSMAYAAAVFSGE
ncbi:hypothetical protein CF336_g9268, partial [Tilletia laevis]